MDSVDCMVLIWDYIGGLAVISDDFVDSTLRLPRQSSPLRPRRRATQGKQDRGNRFIIYEL